jgi:replicative DNA helicase
MTQTQPTTFDPEAFAEILAAKCAPGVIDALARKPVFLPADIAPACFSGLFRPARYKIYYGGRGGSKCLKIGTKIIMADASLRKIEDVQKNDKVMGPDGKSRSVLNTTTGTSELYKVKQSPAIDYIVNSEHILSLKKSNCSKKPYEMLSSGKYRHPNGRYPSWPDITNIKVTEALKQSKRWAEHFRGYKCESLPFPEQEVKIDPYFLGVWLGDGTGRELRITTADKEIIDSCKKYAKSFGGNISVNGKSGNNAKDIGFLIKNGRVNPLWQKFKKYNLPNNKHVPAQYIYNSEQKRLALLAGFIDTDGWLKNNCYEIVQKSETLIRNIWLIANTLGFKTNLRKIKCTCGNNGKVGDYWALTISGNAWRIPVRIARKKINKKDCNPNKDFLVSKVEIESQGIGEYAGIGIDGDHLFLLEDGTVTHNSWSIARALINAAYKKPLRILCTREFQSSIADSVHRLISRHGII